MVQRLEHQRELEAAGPEGHGLRAAGNELQPEFGRGQVLGVLPLVHLQARDAALRMALQQRPRQGGSTAAELDDALGLQRQQRCQHLEFIVDQGHRSSLRCSCRHADRAGGDA